MRRAILDAGYYRNEVGLFIFGISEASKYLVIRCKLLGMDNVELGIRCFPQ